MILQKNNLFHHLDRQNNTCETILEIIPKYQTTRTKTISEIIPKYQTTRTKTIRNNTKISDMNQTNTPETILVIPIYQTTPETILVIIPIYQTTQTKPTHMKQY